MSVTSPKIQFKRGAFVNLPALRAGEPGFTTNRSDFYIGTGAGTTESNQFFGSARYWTREDGANAAQLKLVDANGNNGVSLRSPANAGTGVTYTLPASGTQGYFLKLGADGVLAWDTVTAGASFSSGTFTDSSLVGVTTITNVNIDGGNIDATPIGVTTASTGNFTQLTYSNSSTSGVSTVGSLYVGVTTVLSTELAGITLSNIAAIDSITKATLEASLKLDPNDFDSLVVSGIATFQSAIDAKGGIGVTGGESTFSSATVSDLTSGRVVLAGAAGALEDSSNLTFGAGGLTVGAGGVNVTGVSTFSTDVKVGGDLEVTGNDIKSSSATAITLSGADVEVKGDLQVSGNEVKASDGNTNITMTSNTLTAFAGDIKVGGNDIQASDGTIALSLSGANVTVAGDLTIKGTTTTVNTQTVLVKDSLIELGLEDSGGALVVPTTDANLDVGMVFNYYSGAAKKAAVYWDDSAGRIAFASDATVTNNVVDDLGITYATILAGGLEINNACTGGTSTIISCANNELTLSGVVIDGGSFI